jgi:hypothetical protein
VDGVAPTTAEVRTAAEMPTTMAATTEMCATMTTAVMTTAVATASMTATSMTTTATFRGGIPSGRQHGRENNDGNPDIEF